MLKNVSGLLEVRFVPSNVLKLTIAGKVEDGSLTGRVRVTTGASAGLAIMPEFRCSIPDGLQASYGALDGTLARAEAKPEDAPSILEEAMAHYGGSEPDYPAIEVIMSLLEPTAKHELTRPQLKARIRQIRARLWDAPTIAAHVRNHLDDRLSRFLRSDACTQLPLEVRADLATLSMPLASLEAGDRYLHPVAV